MKTILCVPRSSFIFLGIQDNLTPRPHLQLGRGLDAEPRRWAWVEATGTPWPAQSPYFPFFHGSLTGYVLKMVISQDGSSAT